LGFILTEVEALGLEVAGRMEAVITGLVAVVAVVVFVVLILSGFL